MFLLKIKGFATSVLDKLLHEWNVVVVVVVIVVVVVTISYSKRL